MVCSIACHTLRVSSGEKSEPDLSKLSPGSFDLLDKLAARLESEIGVSYEDGNDSRITYMIQSIELDKPNRRVHGTVARGQSGRVKNIRNRKSKKILLTQGVDDQDESPLHFSVVIPTGKGIGVIFTQKDGIFGCQAPIIGFIKSVLKDNNAQYPARIFPYLPQGWVQKYAEATKAKRVQIELTKLPNAAKAITDKIQGLELAKRALVFNAPRGKALPSVADFLKGYDQLGGGMFSKDTPYGSISVTFDIGNGKSRTWRLGNDHLSYPVVEIENPVTKDGHVTCDFFKGEVKTLYASCEKELFAKKKTDGT
ncbi:MAG: hypothetical protein KF884_02485 [Fimbriimonadaceae bacterium]|nr:hypothetical protein [Fimbriimonadaceae bacterium]QYK58963.1 MAG: hypothetical protein KF884_02485 [Fimbriimonadaceae bacterium]